MAFKLVPKDSFWSDVEVSAPDGSKETLPVLFGHKSRSEFQAFAATDINDVLSDVVRDWKADEPFSKDRLIKALDDMPWLGLALFRAYAQALNGAIAKN